MKQFLHLKSLLIALLVLFAGGGISAADKTETIYFYQQCEHGVVTTVESAGITITFNKGTNNNDPKYFSSDTAIRAYGGNYFTVTANGYNITKIVIGFGSGDGSNEITTDVVTYDNGTWTGTANSVTFTIGGNSGHRRIYSIAVTYSTTADPRTPVTLTYSADKFTTPTEEGEITGAPTLTVTPPEAAQYVVFSSSNTGAAYFDEDGKLIAVEPGTTTITASISGNETYRNAEDSYTLTVGLPSSNLSYKSENETVTYGDDFTAPKLDYTYGYNGTITYKSSNESVAEVDENGVVTIKAVGEATITAIGPATDNHKASKATFTLTVNDIQGSATGALLFKETFDLIGGNGGNDNRWSGSGTASSDLLTNGDKQNTDENGWSVTKGYGGKRCARFGNGDYSGKAITREIPVTEGQDYTLYFNAAPWGTEIAKINVTVTGGTITESNFPTESMTTEAWNELWATITPTASTIKITFSASKKRFFLDEIKVIDPDKAVEVTIPSSGWGTYCCQWPLDLTEEFLPDGFKAYAVSSTSSSEATLTQITEKIIGGTGIIINGTPGTTYTIKVADKGKEYSGTNLLTGTLAPTYIEKGQYFLKSGTFVYSKAGTLPANKAYLKSDGTGTQGAKLSFLFDTTSIEQVKVETSDAWYDLSGRKVNPSSNVKGVYIHNGKKVVK